MHSDTTHLGCARHHRKSSTVSQRPCGVGGMQTIHDRVDGSCSKVAPLKSNSLQCARLCAKFEQGKQQDRLPDVRLPHLKQPFRGY